MATDGTLANPREILTSSIEPVGFYFTGRDDVTGLALTSEQIQNLVPSIAIVQKTRPQVSPALAQYVAATWHLGAKGLRADIEWGTDFVPTAGLTYVGYGRVAGASDKPERIFGYFKAI